MIGDGVVSKVVELFGGAAVELTRGITVIGMALTAQVEMLEIVVGVLLKSDEDAYFESRAGDIVNELKVSLKDLHNDKEEN